MERRLPRERFRPRERRGRRRVERLCPCGYLTRRKRAPRELVAAIIGAEVGIGLGLLLVGRHRARAARFRGARRRHRGRRGAYPQPAGAPLVARPAAGRTVSSAWRCPTSKRRSSARAAAGRSATARSRASRASCPSATASRGWSTPTASSRMRCSPTGSRRASAPTASSPAWRRSAAARSPLMANDPTVKAGSWGPKTVEKIIRIQEQALEHLVPMIYLVDSAGARITEQVADVPRPPRRRAHLPHRGEAVRGRPAGVRAVRARAPPAAPTSRRSATS